MLTSRIKLLQDMAVFGGIDEDSLVFLLKLASSVSLSKGDFFFREGDPAVSMFVLEKGRVSILKTRGGHHHSLGSLTRGDCFGEMALIDLLPRSLSVMAEEQCTAIEISSAALYELYNRSLEQFTMIQMNLAREISRRLRKADEQLFQEIEANSFDVKTFYST